MPSEDLDLRKRLVEACHILDREGLEEVSCECYQVIRGAYREFLPTL